MDFAQQQGQTFVRQRRPHISNDRTVASTDWVLEEVLKYKQQRSRPQNEGQCQNIPAMATTIIFEVVALEILGGGNRALVIEF